MSGDESLAFLRDASALPSLILLDLKMVGMDGIEVLRRIRSDSSLANIPVVIVTHSALESDRKDAYRAGATEFLQKSLAIDRFSEDLRSVLERRIGLN
jgi:CheY-like chemotaxis protein